MKTDPDSADRDDRLDEVVAAYFEAQARGESPRAESWIAHHPDLADGLTSFFAAEEGFRRLAAPLAAPPPNVDFPRPFGDYTLLRAIGRGGMGVVFEARQGRLDRPVALKMIPDGLLAAPVDLLRFRFEADAIAKLDHPRIVPVFEAGEHEGRPFFSMKLVPGGSLADALDRFRDDPRAAARLVLDAAEAVHHAHRRGLLHRDLKPSNLLLDADGSVLVSDFGLAKSLDAESTLTETGAILGSPPYMAPEQAAGDTRQITVATDVYGLGAVLYALLTGDAPFRGLTPIETLDRVRNDPPEPPGRVNRRVDRDLETICLKCLAKDPHRRYASAESLADDLRRWLDGRSIRARRTGPATRLVKWARRYPALATVGAALIVVGLAGLSGVIWQWREAVRARDALELSFYASRIILADGELQAGNVAKAEILLEECPPALRGWEWRFLRRRRRSRVEAAGEPGSVIASLAYSPDGRHLGLLSTGRSATTLILRDVATGGKTWEQPAHRPGIAALAFHPDGHRIATAGADGAAKVWDAATGREIWAFAAPPPAAFWSLAYSPDGSLLALGEDRAISILDAGTGRRVAHLDGHTDRVYGLAYHPDGTRLASAADDGEVRIWDASTGRIRRVLIEGSLLPIKCLAYSPDGSRIAAGTEYGGLIAWDAETGRELARVYAHTWLVQRLAFDPTGRRLATCGEDHLVKVWDAGTFRELLTLRGHDGRVRALAFSPDGSELASAEAELRRWDATPLGRRNEGEAVILRGHTALVEGVAYSADGKLLGSASHDRTVIIRDAESGAARLTLGGPAGALSTIAFRPDGREVAASGWDRVIKVWDLTTGRERLSLPGHARTVTALAYSPDGRVLASAAWEPRIILRDADSGRERRSIGGFRGYVYDLAFDPTGRLLAAAVGDDTARIWVVETGAPVLVIDGFKGRVASVSFSPDGRRLATGGLDGVEVWDVPTGRPVLSLPGVTAEVRAVAFSPDGRRLATGAEDRTVAVWDAATGRRLAEFQDTVGPVRHIAFRPDGRRLAATGSDKTVRVWDLDDLLDRPTAEAR